MLKRQSVIVIFFVLCLLPASLAIAKGEVNQNTSPFANMTGQEILEMLQQNNKTFQKNSSSKANLSSNRRQETAKGQHPYAIIVTCSDSRTPPEHIFNAGLGELFVIRNAGNIININELGSIEYAVEHLNVKLIIVMGHTKCGAVGAALKYNPESKKNETNLQKVIRQVHQNLKDEDDPQAAEIINVQNSLEEVSNDAIIAKYIKDGSVLLRGAIYNVHTGAVEFFE